MTGIVCKITGIVLFVLSIIVSVPMGFATFITAGITGFVTCVSLYALGEIIDLLSSINDRTYQIYYNMENNSDTSASETMPSASNPHSAPAAVNINTNSDGTWFCGECGSKNLNNSRFCSSCGKYR